MKSKVVVVIVLIAVVIAGGIIEQIMVEKVFDELGEKLKTIETEDGVFDLGKAEEVHEWWAKKHEYLELTLPHAQLNEIEYNFGELIGTIKAEDNPSSEAMLERLIISASTLKEMNRFDAGNVF